MSDVRPNSIEVTKNPAQAGNDGTQMTSTSASEQLKNTNLAGKFVAKVLRGIPTLTILAMLTGLAYWGHHHGWNIPKFSELTGNHKEADVPWCDAHGVPESDCIACNADLMPKGEIFGWCKEHGVHECVLHHPQASQLREIPDITPENFAQAARAIAARPRTKNDPNCKMHLRRIQFPSTEAVDQAGIDINLVDRGPLRESIKTTGEVVYDPTRVAHLSSRAMGAIWRVEKNVGDIVKQGEVLALVDAVEVGRLKSQLLQALIQLELDLKSFERLSTLGGGVIPLKQIEESVTKKENSEFEVNSLIQALSNLGLTVSPGEILGRPISDVRSELKFLGLPKSVLATMDQSRDSDNLIPLISPRDGVVVNRDAVAGEVIETSNLLFTIADTSQMWLLLNVRLEEVERISLGQKIVFQPDGSQNDASGAVTWISTEVESQTRTVQVRGELSNPNGRLRNETFGAGEIVIREEQDAILVSSDAIHWEGCCHIAFVRDKNYFQKGAYTVFHTRSVRPGATIGDNVEVIAGLLPGEVVVTKGSGILRAELLKGKLGAG